MTEDPQPPSFSPLHRWGIGVNVVLSVLALAALVVMVNYLAIRHFKRFHWTSDARYDLSVPTRQLLHSLTNELKITMLFDSKDALFAPVAGLLEEYGDASPMVRLEQVDYKRDLGRAQLVIANYQLPPGENDLVVFDLNHRTKVVRAAELSDYDWTRLMEGAKEVKRIAFKGEPIFTDAIAGLLDPRPPLACFLGGHREHDPASEEQKFGYAKFAKLLTQKNIIVKPLGLEGTNTVPDECRLLILAGPRDRLDPVELEKIGKYLNQGGRLLALLSRWRSQNKPSGVERMLAGWGVALGEDYVFDPAHTVTDYDLVCTNFGSHAITKPLDRSQLYLVWARSVSPFKSGATSGDGPKVLTLVATGGDGYTASDLDSAGVPRVNPQRDRHGSISLAVAVEKGSLPGVSVDRGATRMVIVGESVFLGGELIDNVGNLEFANQAVNWLLDRPQHMAGIVARPLEEHSITLTRAEMNHVRVILLGVMPGGVLLLGALVWLRRRA